MAGNRQEKTDVDFVCVCVWHLFASHALFQERVCSMLTSVCERVPSACVHLLFVFEVCSFNNLLKFSAGNEENTPHKPSLEGFPLRGS